MLKSMLRLSHPHIFAGSHIYLWEDVPGKAFLNVLGSEAVNGLEGYTRILHLINAQHVASADCTEQLEYVPLLGFLKGTVSWTS